MNGQPTVTVQFNFGDTFIHNPIEFQPDNPPRWTMPSDLAGVLWLDHEFPFTATWRANSEAQTPAPERLTGVWKH